MKPLVIYHANCADGFGAAFAAWLKFGDEAEYVPFGYNQEERLRELFVVGDPKRDIYILDFSFPRELMDWLFSVAKRVVWLDHHKTAFEMYSKEPNANSWNYYDQWGLGIDITGDSQHQVILDNTRSGAMIAWEYFHPEKEVPMLIKHIDDYDRWQFKLEGTKEFNKALWSYAPWSFEQWYKMFFIQTGFSAQDGFEPYEGYGDMYKEGAAILRAHDANVQAVVKGAGRSCVIPVLEEGSYIPAGGLAANCPPHLSSDVGHQLANASGTYGLLWHINKEGKCVCSLRSNGDYDVSTIARAFGGGGHKNAAGFEIAIETLLEWIK